MKSNRIITLVVTALLVFTLSAMRTVPVFADDGAPPPPEAPAAEVPPAEAAPADSAPANDAPADVASPDVAPADDAPADVASPDVAPADDAPADVAPADDAPADTAPADIAPADVAPADVAPADAAPADAAPADVVPVDVAPADDAPTDSATLPELLDQLPEGTDVVTVDANGEVVSLGTTEAAQIAATGDPMWCPTGVTPGAASCSPSGNTSFKNVIDWLDTHELLAKAGVIWIEGSYDSSTAVGDGASTNFSLDNVTLGNWANFAITLKGGWTGSGTAIDTTNPSEFHGDSLSIVGWKADVTLSDLLITGVTGLGTTALTIDTTKNITLTRVEVKDNSGSGADLNNSGGTGNVTVTSSKFNTNAGGNGGLTVTSKGVITLNSVTANGNGYAGARLYNTSGTAGVTLTGSNTFNTNNYTGLIVYSNGAITINSLTASSSVTGAGAYLSNLGAPVLTPKNVTLTGTNIFNDNSLNGLEVYSNGAISLNNVTANLSATGWGATLDNSGATSAQPITLTGTNTFNDNNKTGLGVWSNGAITASNLTANSNVSWIGAYLQNDESSFISNVTLTGTNTFNGNNWAGLIVYSHGAITLNNVTANGSLTSRGAHLDNCGWDGLSCTYMTAHNVTLTGTNNFNDNSLNGLEVYSNGAITLNNVTANGNGYDGTYLDNSAAATAKPVTLTGTNYFEDNAQAGDEASMQMGLKVYSKGAITINNLSANYNGNGDTDTDDGGVWLDNTIGTAGVTMTGTNTVSENEWGLGIFTNGAVKVNNLIANSNGGGSGAYIDNCFWNGTICTNTVAAPVTFSGANEFKFNNRGLHVYSNGAISLNNVTATNNHGVDDEAGGTYLRNNFAFASDVTLTGTNIFEDNGRTGLTVLSNGVISLNNISADGNGWGDDDPVVDPSPYGGYGAFLDNTFGAPKAVRLTGTNEFNSNYSGGLFVYSRGPISANNLSASWNETDVGAYLANYLSNLFVPQSVTLTGTNNFDNNGYHGLLVESYGAITLNNLNVNENAGEGVFLDNYGNGTIDFPEKAALPTNITINGANNFNRNDVSGLLAYSLGAITLNNVRSIENGGWGAHLFNQYPTAVGAITVNGTSEFSRNGWSGLEAFSKGNIVVANLDANQNGEYGVFLDNNFAGSTGTVSVGTSLANRTNEFTENGYSGLVVYSRGAVTLNNVGAYANGWDNGNAWMTWGAFDNPEDGTIIGYDYNDEGVGYGVYVDNWSAPSTLPANVTINGASWFDTNWLSGLEVWSVGAITTNNLSAQNNGKGNFSGYGNGVYLDNVDALVTLPRAITLNGVNDFNNNYDEGLAASSMGNITVNKLNANQNGTPTNGSHGALLRNNYDGVGNINVTGYANVNGNWLSGLEAYSYGTITLANVNADWNGNGDTATPGFGVYLDNHEAATPKAVTITGTNNFNHSSSSNPDYAVGLAILSKGAITLNNVNAYQNLGDGVYLDNDFAGALGGVAINGTSGFYENGRGWSDTSAAPDPNFWNPDNWRSGLVAWSRGNIVLAKFEANDNGADGVYLNNTNGAGNVTVGTTLANWINGLYNNWHSGMEVFSNGIVTMTNMEASNNGYTPDPDPSTSQPATLDSGFGIWVDNHLGALKAVTFNGTNQFNNNVSGGLVIDSKGAITVKSLDANNNHGFGAALNNNYSGASGGATITGYAYTTDNFNYGMQVTSRGAITINVVDMWAGNNGGYGWYLDNSFSGAVGGITLSSVNKDWAFDFDNNGDYGLWAQSLGTISVTGLDASRNGGFGAILDNAFLGSTGTVTVTTTATGRNNFNDNSGDGLNVFSNRAITVNNLNVNNNSGDGVNIDNTYYGSGLTPPGVTISGSNRIENNQDNGLVVKSFGLIALNSITARNNGRNATGNPPAAGTGWGAYLDNCGYDDLTSSCTSSLAKAVTLTGVNEFNDNLLDGLWITSKGAISVSSLSGNNNQDRGAYLDNQWGPGSLGGITILGYAKLNGNLFDGLQAYSHGSISMNSISTNGNGGNGADLDTGSLTATPVNITLTGTNGFYGNGNHTSHTGNGLNAYTDGKITINNLTAKWNASEGAVLNNWTYSTVPATVTLTGVNTFIGNYDNGLSINSRGAVTASKLTSDRNGGSGVFIGADGNITVACGSMTNNGIYGWQMYSYGTITLKGVFAFGNGSGNYADPTPVIIRTCP